MSAQSDDERSQANESATRAALPDLWIGRVLQRAGLVPEEQLKLAVAQQEGAHTLAERLVALGVVDEEQVHATISQHVGIRFVEIELEDLALEAVTLVPEKVCRIGSLIPIAEDVGTITVATADPRNDQALRVVRMVTGREVKPVLVSWPNLRALLKHVFEQPESADEVADRVAAEVDENLTYEPKTTTVDGPEHARPPLIRLVNLMIFDAINKRASDLHIEPREGGVEVRFRVDGLLYKVTALPRRVLRPIVSRIKLMAGLDIADSLRPQDGQAVVKVREEEGTRSVELRVSTLPSKFGEKVVIRILDQAAALESIEQLGLSAPILESLRHCLDTPQGLILVTGPTGSGKTTTLYSLLRALRAEARNIISVEDPVEYHVPDITQVSVRPETGLTFAAALRSILRQDPDVILVGEVRDPETAAIVVRASMTGHLVLSTLHTNDAVSTVLRLQDLGVEPFKVADSLVAVLAQRLVRHVCTECSVPMALQDIPELMAWAERTGEALEDISPRRVVGCAKCQNTGYAGRLAVAELLVMTDPLRQVLRDGRDKGVIQRETERTGMILLRDDAVAHVAAGRTTLEEMMRIIGPEAEETGDEPEPQAAMASSLAESDMSVENLPAIPDDTDKLPRVLIAEDDAQLRRMVTRVLIDHGFEVDEATDGEDTLAKVVRLCPDLLLLDVVMDKFDGFDVCRRLRLDMATLSLPVIMMTALGTQEDQLQGFKVGADDYIIKPFDFDLLIARIVAVLRRTAMRFGA